MPGDLPDLFEIAPREDLSFLEQRQEKPICRLSLLGENGTEPVTQDAVMRGAAMQHGSRLGDT